MKKYIIICISIVLITNIVYSQDNQHEKSEKGFEFTMIYQVDATPVKDQNRSGTCWSFAAISFLESELMRLGKGKYDLSEMFNVRYSYPAKAQRYIRYHGMASFGGGQAHDVMNVVKEYGLIPESVYSGKRSETEGHNHNEMDAILKSMLEGIIKKSSKPLTPYWMEAFESVLDVYLGEVPKKFKFNNKEYTPLTFKQELGINPDDYIELTSYSHHPYYKPFILEVPDNWSDDLYYNLPINDLLEVMEYALDNGYSICWDGDVSEKGFSHKNGVAFVPLEDTTVFNDTERAKWEQLSERDRKSMFYNYKEPVKEKIITQEMRQETFNNYAITDDHLMHITGLAKDINGTKYYYTKNSWNTNGSKENGFIYMSESYIKLTTIAIMVHKDAIPNNIVKKLMF